MADIRIKDLTTTASSTASDDFIAVDGTTNGTRKLNAFSPTFGGNATVTGTLTVNGVATASAGISIGDGTFGAGKIYTSATGGLSLGAKTGSSYDFILADPSGNLIAYVPTGTTRMVLSSTTASTTTSTGALVVSGGLGVGGAINAGGTLRVVGSSQIIRVRHDASNIEFTNTAQDAYVAATVIGNTLQLSGNNGNGILIGATGIATVQATTASTSTSSGALVVSGGVGVAGAINAGDQIKSERTSGTDSASAVLGVLTTTGAGVTNSFGIDARVIVNNSSGTTASATGLRALSRVSNVSTVTQAVAMLAQVDNPGGGTITTAYGLYVNPITAGGTNYAIYTGGGRINFQSLPTSSAGLAAGTIWNDGGTLKVA